MVRGTIKSIFKWFYLLHLDQKNNHFYSSTIFVILLGRDNNFMKCKINLVWPNHGQLIAYFDEGWHNGVFETIFTGPLLLMYSECCSLPVCPLYQGRDGTQYG